MIQSVRGTKDILPENINLWSFAENIFRNSSKKFGYKELRTPIFEKTEVFSRSIGDTSDIVNKEMYTFVDKGGESITLRPEMTAALVRSVIQNSLIQKNPLLRLWYFGPFFRYERPQKGRLRQFHQYGAECIGSNYPESDAEVILLAIDLIKSLGISNFKLLINSLGSANSRENYKKELVDYLIGKQSDLSADSKMRLELNPLRILDSKDEKDKLIIAEAPNIIDFLDNESKEHFETVLDLVKMAEIPIEIHPRLVRGLDYYSYTVFEFQSSELGAQDSIGGGGRYNTLFEQLSGKPTPAVGFALGVERLLLLLENKINELNINDAPDINLIVTDSKFINYAQTIAFLLRNDNYCVEVDLLRRSTKAQLREANKSGVKFSIFIGNDEFENNTISVKNMKTSEQSSIKIDDIKNFNFRL